MSDAVISTWNFASYVPLVIVVIAVIALRRTLPGLGPGGYRDPVTRDNFDNRRSLHGDVFAGSLVPDRAFDFHLVHQLLDVVFLLAQGLCDILG